MPKKKPPARTTPSVGPIESLIRVIRGQKIILDNDLAVLYRVQTSNLNKAVKRNIERFPEEFMFQLTREEFESLTFQNGISNSGRGGRRFLPYAFTEHGVAMLSSVLRSPQAVQMNIVIIKAFVRMRELVAANKDLAARVDKLEHGQDRTASVIEVIVEDIDRLAEEVQRMKMLPEPKKRRIGFRVAAND